MNVLTIDAEVVKHCLANFISSEVKEAGFSCGIVGLSGGLDSSLVAFLSAEALGKDNLTTLHLPYKTSDPKNAEHAQQVARTLGVDLITVDITPQIDTYFERFPDAGKLRRANKMARERMTVLYDHSSRLKAMVIGTSNKTEILLGYGTIYGDMACGINPIGGLYKTQLRQLAKHIGVPDEIIGKTPSADLWPGQTDEGELGFTYAEIDKLLFYLVDKRLKDTEIGKMGLKPDLISRVKTLIRKSSYKRRPPKVAPIPESAFLGT